MQSGAQPPQNGPAVVSMVKMDGFVGDDMLQDRGLFQGLWGYIDGWMEETEEAGGVDGSGSHKQGGRRGHRPRPPRPPQATGKEKVGGPEAQANAKDPRQPEKGQPLDQRVLGGGILGQRACGRGAGDGLQGFRSSGRFLAVCRQGAGLAELGVCSDGGGLFRHHIHNREGGLPKAHGNEQAEQDHGPQGVLQPGADAPPQGVPAARSLRRLKQKN